MSQTSQVQFANIPELLRSKNKWVCADRLKAPIQTNGWYARSTQASTWNTFEVVKTAYTVYQQYGGQPEIHGVGFVCDDTDDIIGIDLDKIDLEGRGERAAEIQKRLSRTYQERSPSGRGVRIWTRGKLPFSGGNNKELGIEVYQSLHYLTVTGDRLNEADIVDDQQALDWFVGEYFKGHRDPALSERPEYDTDVVEALADEIRDHLRGRPGTTSGRDASGACLRVVADVAHGFELDADAALPFLMEWAERDDQRDEHDHYSPWSEREIIHKIESALRKGTDREPGWLLPGWWYDQQHGDEIAAMVKPWVGPVKPKQSEDFDLEKYEKKPEKKRRRLTADEIENMPDPEWLVRRHLTNHSLTVLAGPPGSCKSFWSLNVALAIVTGNSLFGQFKVKRGQVAYIYSEGESGLKYRLRAWRQFNRIQDIPEDFGTYPYRYDLLSRDEAVGIIQQMIEDYSGMPGLVIIDTLARNFGGGDENSTRDMNQFIAVVDLFRAAGASVIVVHHTGKDATRGERGSSVLRGAADNLILTERADDQMYLSCEKMKDGSPFSRYVLDLVPQVVGSDPDGEEITSIALNYAGSFTEKKENKEQLEYQEWVRLLAAPEDGVTVADATKNWTVARSTAQTRLDKLAKEGFLDKIDGTKYPPSPAKYTPKK